MATVQAYSFAGTNGKNFVAGFLWTSGNSGLRTSGVRRFARDLFPERQISLPDRAIPHRVSQFKQNPRPGTISSLTIARHPLDPSGDTAIDAAIDDGIDPALLRTYVIPFVVVNVGTEPRPEAILRRSDPAREEFSQPPERPRWRDPNQDPAAIAKDRKNAKIAKSAKVEKIENSDITF
jgi:hypothetical protein